jgi:uncharacterized membrane protein
MTEDPSRVATIAAGSVLTLAGLSKGGVIGIAAAAVGGNLVYGGVTGSSPLHRALKINQVSTDGASASLKHGQESKTERSIIIDKPRDEIYRFWRDFTNLPRFMPTVQSVRVDGDRRSHWTMTGPSGLIEWDAEIINEVENDLIAWRTLDATINNAGTVTFTDATGGRGTMVRLVINYQPPMGVLGAVAAKILPQDPAKVAGETLRRLKQYLETGEVMTSEMRPGETSSSAGGNVTGLSSLKKRLENGRTSR